MGCALERPVPTRSLAGGAGGVHICVYMYVLVCVFVIMYSYI